MGGRVGYGEWSLVSTVGFFGPKSTGSERECSQSPYSSIEEKWRGRRKEDSGGRAWARKQSTNARDLSGKSKERAERTFLKRELPFVLGSKGGKLNATDDVEVESPSRRLLVLAYISSTTCYTFLRLIRHSSRRSLVFLFPALNVALRKARRASWFIQYNPSQMPPYWLMARGPLLSFVVFAPQRRH